MRRRPLCKACYYELHKAGLLNEFPLIPADKTFKTTLTEKYGNEILVDFNNLLNQDNKSLADIADKYGFTRERARQLFEKIHKFHYTVIKKQRSANRLEKRQKDQQLRKNPCDKILRFKEGDNNQFKGALAEKRVFDICAALSYDIRPFTKGQQIDLIINGYHVDIKSSYTPTITSPRRTSKQFHFSISEYQRTNCDFIICYAVLINSFFIIPINEYPNADSLYIPEKPQSSWICNGMNKHRKSKWYDYLEAWHLLKTPAENEVIFNRLLSEKSVVI